MGDKSRVLITDGERVKLPGLPRGLECYRVDRRLCVWDSVHEMHADITGLGSRGRRVVYQSIAGLARVQDGLTPYTTTDPAIAAAAPNTFELIADR